VSANRENDVLRYMAIQRAKGELRAAQQTIFENEFAPGEACELSKDFDKIIEQIEDELE